MASSATTTTTTAALIKSTSELFKETIFMQLFLSHSLNNEPVDYEAVKSF
jgi:hypothetical protein